MSKVEQLRQKYPNITTTTFKKFESSDKTKTKKYLPFMLETWINRNYHIKNSNDLVNLVNMFDELLPYIENKDIYHKDYKNIEYFLEVINDGIDEKDEKLFIRDEHVNVIYESDKYVLLQPKTHKGSCKYGANTKWCTASKRDEATFNRYSKQGFLVYLISKEKDKGVDYQKIAFHIKKASDPFIDSIDVYSAPDVMINSEKLISGGWDIHEMFTIISMVRANFSNWKRLQTAKENIKLVINNLNNIDFNILSQSIKIVENNENDDYISEVKGKINEFIKQIPVKL